MNNDNISINLNISDFEYSKSVFVSSTFRDMQNERDILHMSVLPELNEFARKYGGSIRFTDLRWGVNTTNLESTAGSKKVLKVCLDEINNCRPYMVVLLGDRYGWMPDLSLIVNSAKERGYTPHIIDKISVTELEIHYGALDNPEQLKRSLFYFRKSLPVDKMTDEQKSIYVSETDEDYRKMEHLKDEIRKKGGIVSEYEVEWDTEKGVIGLEEFAKMVKEDIKELLLKEWGPVPESLSWQDRALISDRCFIAEKCGYFLGRADAIAHCRRFVESSDNMLLIIRGEAGTGKSSLMCYLSRLLTDNKHSTVSIFCGSNTYSTNAWQILLLLIYKFEVLLGVTDHFKPTENLGKSDRYSKYTYQLNECQDKLCELIRSYINKTEKEPIILIDALDQLIHEEMAENLQFLPNLFEKKLSIIVTCLPDHTIPSHLMLAKNSEDWKLSSLSENDLRLAVSGILSANRKELDKRVFDELIKLSGARTALYLSMALQRLMMFDSDDFSEIARNESSMKPDDAICSYMLEILHKLPDNIEDLCVFLVNEVGERINPVLVGTVTDLISISRYGLRESDLIAIFSSNGLKWDAIDFSLLKRYLSNYFVELEDGRINYTHKSIRNGLFNKTQNQKIYIQWIFEHLKILNPNDSVKVSEIVYHAYLANQQEFLIEYFKKLEEDAYETISKTAESVREICLSGGDEWFSNFFQKVGEIGDTKCLNFLNFDLSSCFKKSIYELNILYKLFLAAIHGLDSPHNIIKSNNVLRCYSISLNCIGNILTMRGEYDQSLEYNKKALEIAENLEKEMGTPEARRDVSISLDNIGDILDAQGKYDQALAYYKKSLNIREMLEKEMGTPEARRDVSISLDNIGDILDVQGKYDQALAHYKKSLNIREMLEKEMGTPEAKRDVMISLSHVGSILDAQSEYGQAIINYIFALKIAKNLEKELGTPEAKRDVLISLNNVGRSLKRIGEYSHSLLCYAKSLGVAEDLEKELGTPRAKRDVAISLDNVGMMNKIVGGYDQALVYYKNALEIREVLEKEMGTPEARRDVSISLDNIGDILDAQGKYDQALVHYKKSLNICEMLEKEMGTPETKADVSILLANIGNILYEQKDYDQALVHYKKELKIAEDLEKEMGMPEAKRNLSVSLNHVGNVLDAQGKYDQALVHYKKSLNIREVLKKEQETIQSMQDLSYSLNSIADTLITLEDYDQAIVYSKKALVIAEDLEKELENPDPESRSDVALCLNRIGDIYRSQGDYKQALVYHKMAVKITKEALKISKKLDKEPKSFEADSHDFDWLLDLVF